jgi:hypothetical protein
MKAMRPRTEYHDARRMMIKLFQLLGLQALEFDRHIEEICTL